MPNYHPDIHLLTEFAAGNLCDAKKLCIAAHLEHCRECRITVLQLNQLGGILFDQACSASDALQDKGIQLEENALDKVFAAIDRAELAESNAAPNGLGAASASEQLGCTEHLATVVGNTASEGTKYLGSNVSSLLHRDNSFTWERINRSLSIGRIKIDDPKREVALHRLQAGGKVSNHDHRGREFTVVLTGSFSDQDGLYLPGDFLVREPGQAHQPIASKDGSCVCLSVLEAPIKFTGLSRLLNPFLRLKPRAA